MNYTIRNLLIATALMVVGIVLTTSFISKERRDLSRGKQEITVFVAKKEIPPGTPAKQLEEGGYLDTKEIVREDAPPNPISDLRDLDKLISNDTVYKDDVLTMRAFDKKAGLSATASIKGNQRLGSIGFNSANTIGHLVRPGDRIDVMASMKLQAPDGGGQIFKTWMVARDLLVVETPDSLTPQTGDEPVEAKAPEVDGEGQVFVLQATDDEWSKLWLAQSASDSFKLTMLLRGASGDTETPIEPLLSLTAVDQSKIKPPPVANDAPKYQLAPDDTQL